MPEKQGYEELEKRVKELEKEVANCKQAEEDLAWLASFPEQNPNPIIEINSEDRVTYLNPVAARRFPDLPATAVRHPILEGLLPIIGPLQSGEQTSVTREIAVGDSFYEQRITYVPERNLMRVFARDITERKRAEEALKREKELAEEYLNIAGVMLATINADENIALINKKGCEILGYNEGELIGKNWFGILVPERIRSEIRGVFGKLMAGEIEPVEYYENPLLTKDGEERLISFHNTVIRNPNGQIVGVLLSGEDITERKQAEEALREREEKYRTILEGIEEGYYEVDIVGNLTFFNDSMCKILGYSRDELMGMNYRQYAAQEDVHKTYQTFNKVYTTGNPSRIMEHGIIRKDGTKGYGEISASLRKGSKGQPIGFRGIMRDVTERRQIETELIQTRNFLQNIFNSSIDGITTTDLKGNIIYTSPRAKDILGYEQKEIIGKKVFNFYGNGIEDAKTIMKELTEKGELRNHEMNVIKKHGGLIDISLSASFLKDEKEEVIGILGFYRDITDNKTIETQLRYAQKMEAIGTLAGGIAHNFNNLLMSIQGNTSLMLLETDPAHPNYERLKTIEKSVQGGSKLTKQLLGYAREGRYEIRPISLNKVVKEISDTFGTTKKEIRIHHELAEDLLGIIADQGQIEQVILNLYVNAADAMPRGGDLFLKTINVTHEDMKGKPYTAKPGNYVLATVRDTGLGMDKKTMQRIFDPFFTTKGLAKGTGLGLASVYGIVKAHGGYIDVDSVKRQGTTFSVYLPASKRKVEEDIKTAEHIIEGRGNILLADDEAMVLEVGVKMIKKLGYTVLEAKGGREAVDIYKASKDITDMVILDMIMPDMGGGEAYDRMKEINPNVKVLLSSGYNIDGQATEILKRGCDGFIQKPFNMKDLSQKLRQILDKKGS